MRRNALLAAAASAVAVTIPGAPHAASAAAAPTATTPSPITAPAPGPALPPVVEPAAAHDCTGAPPQQYSLYPLRGCLLTPTRTGWANEMCRGFTGQWFCREVAGHVQQNNSPNADWSIYKTDVMKYSAFDAGFGMELTTNAGWILEGCTTWSFVVADATGHQNYSTTCDYKLGATGPLQNFKQNSGDYFYDTLRHWANHTYSEELGCASTIANTWTGAADINDIAPSCIGIFTD